VVASVVFISNLIVVGSGPFYWVLLHMFLTDL